MNVSKIAGRVANSVNPDQTPRSAASDLGLHCLLRLVCPKIRVSTVVQSIRNFEPPIKEP